MRSLVDDRGRGRLRANNYSTINFDRNLIVKIFFGPEMSSGALRNARPGLDLRLENGLGTFITEEQRILGIISLQPHFHSEAR